MSLAAGGHDLHFLLRQPAHFVDQEQIRGLGHRHRQLAAHAKQRQHQVGFHVLAGQQFDDLRIVQSGFELGVRHAVLLRQTFDNLILRAISLFDQDFAQQSVAAVRLLAFQRALQRFRGEIAAFHQQIAQPGWRRVRGAQRIGCHGRV